jgi:hypothetical protein
VTLVTANATLPAVTTSVNGTVNGDTDGQPANGAGVPKGLGWPRSVDGVTLSEALWTPGATGEPMSA